MDEPSDKTKEAYNSCILAATEAFKTEWQLSDQEAFERLTWYTTHLAQCILEACHLTDSGPHPSPREGTR